MPDVSLSGIEFTIKGSSDSASDSINKLIKNLSSLNSALKNTNGIKEFSKNMSSLGNAIKAISATTLKRIGDALLKISKAGVKGIGGILSAPFKSGYSKLSGYAKSLSGVVRGFKRIIGYRIIRSIIREITQAFSEGIQNLYGWSALVGGKFKTSMDQIATSMTYFKNSIAAAVAPIINALAPAIDWLVDKIVVLINVLNQLFAKLTGATYWTRAKKKAQEFGDAVSGAGQAAEDALHYLAPFDELNVLPDNKDKGGGGGGGTDYSDMFEDVTEFNEAISNFADMIREKIDAGDWIGLGILLGEKVNDLVDAIDWAGIGSTVGGYINAWFTTRYWTLETVNFQNIGAKIAEFLNSAMEQIDFNIIGRTITQKFTIFGDLIIGAIENIDWTSVGNSARDLIVGAFNQLSQWISRIDWGNFGSTFYTALKNTLEGLDLSGIASSLMRLLGSALGGATSLLSSFVSDVVTDIKNYFLQYIEDENGDGCFGGGEILEGVLKGIDNAIKNLATWVHEHIGIPFKNAFKNNLTIDVDNIFQPIVDKWNEFVAEHPGLAQIFGWGDGESTSGPGAHSGTSHSSLSIDITGNVTDLTDSVPGDKKVISGAKVNVSKTSFDALSDAQKTIPSIAKFTEMTNSLTGSKVPTFESKADFTSSKNSLTGSKLPTFKSKANFTSIRNSYGTPSINSLANLTKAKVSMTSPNVDANAALINPRWKNGTPTMDVNGNVTPGNGGRAMGGVYSGGQWHDIARYGSGGMPIGSQLFWAREKGPELVGTLGSHTAVMNNDQIVASVSAGVARAIAGIRFQMTGFTSAPAPSQDNGMSEETLYRAFLAALNDSDIGDRPIELDGDVIYRNVLQRNRMERRRLGANPMMATS